MSKRHTAPNDAVVSRRLPAGRQAALAAYLSEVGEVTVAELSERFQVSADTVRRDLDRLDADGVLVRTHGGAMVSTGRRARRDTAFDVRLRMGREVKEAIGRAAADLVADESAVVIGSGTTALAVARNIKAHDLIVVTNNLLVPGALPQGLARDVYILGGAVRVGAQATVGPVVFGSGTRAERGIRCDLAIIGVGGIAPGVGITTSHVGEAEMMAEMMHVSRRVAVLADSTKFGEVLFTQVVPLEQIDVLVTDKEPPQDLAEALAAAGVEVVLPQESADTSIRSPQISA